MKCCVWALLAGRGVWQASSVSASFCKGNNRLPFGAPVFLFSSKTSFKLVQLVVFYLKKKRVNEGRTDLMQRYSCQWWQSRECCEAGTLHLEQKDSETACLVVWGVFFWSEFQCFWKAKEPKAGIYMKGGLKARERWARTCSRLIRGRCWSLRKDGTWWASKTPRTAQSGCVLIRLIPPELHMADFGSMAHLEPSNHIIFFLPQSNVSSSPSTTWSGLGVNLKAVRIILNFSRYRIKHQSM